MAPQPRTLADEAAILVLLIAVSYPVGLAVDPMVVLPLLNALPAWWFMARRLRAGDLGGAVRLMLVFPVALAVFGTVALALWPTADGLTPVVFNGPQYREEMFTWIRTGVGSEGNWRLFLPMHVTHLLVFVVLSLLTGSLVSITGGAILTNYMDGYVASIHRAANGMGPCPKVRGLGTVQNPPGGAAGATGTPGGASGTGPSGTGPGRWRRRPSPAARLMVKCVPTASVVTETGTNAPEDTSSASTEAVATYTSVVVVAL